MKDGLFTNINYIIRIINGIKSIFKYRYSFIHSFYNNSIETLPIVIIISGFIGMVTAIQTKHQTYMAVPYNITIDIIFKSIVIELGPVIIGLILAGKLGSGMASKIGSMKLTKQVDALITLSVDPIEFLAVPEVVSSVIVFPLLTIIGNIIAIVGSYFVVVFFWNITSGQFFEGIEYSFSFYDILVGLVKSFSFGFIVSVVGTYNGFQVENSSYEVGERAVKGVVYSSILILIADYVIAQIMLGGIG